jgi:hypothetical protein
MWNAKKGPVTMPKKGDDAVVFASDDGKAEIPQPRGFAGGAMQCPPIGGGIGTYIVPTHPTGTGNHGYPGEHVFNQPSI